MGEGQKSTPARVALEAMGEVNTETLQPLLDVPLNDHLNGDKYTTNGHVVTEPITDALALQQDTCPLISPTLQPIRISDGLGQAVIRSQPREVQQQLEGTVPLLNINFVHKGNLLPGPYHDDYLSQMSLFVAGEGETLVTHTLIPGFRQKLIEIGVLGENTNVIELRHPGSQEMGQSMYGYPYGDPLETLRRVIDDDGAVLRNGDTGQTFVLIPTLYNEHVQEQAESLGIQTYPQPFSNVTNNKARSRRIAETVGIDMFPGEVIQSEEDLQRLEERMAREGWTAPWGKHSDGSGGDMVDREDDLRKRIRDIRQSMIDAHRYGEFDQPIEEVWPEGDFLPEGQEIVFERHAEDLGTLEIIGSNHFLVTAEGELVQDVTHFRQSTDPDGNWVGSQRYHPDAVTQQMIENMIELTAQQSRNIGFYGIQGTDLIVVQTAEGRKVYKVEDNGRMIMSTPPAVLAERLGISEWSNTNITLPINVSSWEDFEQAVGEDLLLTRERLDAGDLVGIFPLGFRTVVGEDGIIPHPHCKIFIAGNEEQQQAIRNALKARDIRLGIEKNDPNRELWEQ